MKFNHLETTSSQQLEKKLTPINGSIPDDIFVEEESISFLKKEIKNLQDPEVLKTGKIALSILSKDHNLENVNIVDNIKISKITGKYDRYLMDVLTSGSGQEKRLSKSVIVFDMNVKDFNEPSPHRQDRNWIIGEKNGEKQIIGVYKDFMDKGDIEKFLKSQGYSNFSEAWIADFDRHVGFLGKDNSQE